MSKLVTSDNFSSLNFLSGSSNKTSIYDESQLLDLQMYQKDRELFIASHLHSIPNSSYRNSLQRSTYKSKSQKVKHSIQSLRQEIKAIRKERKKILENGLQTVQSYMNQLQKEQEEYNDEIQRIRAEITKINHEFIVQVSEIEKYSNRKKINIDDVLKEVKKYIEKSGELSAGQSISSIQLIDSPNLKT